MINIKENTQCLGIEEQERLTQLSICNHSIFSIDDENALSVFNEKTVI